MYQHSNQTIFTYLARVSHTTKKRWKQPKEGLSITPACTLVLKKTPTVLTLPPRDLGLYSERQNTIFFFWGLSTPLHVLVGKKRATKPETTTIYPPRLTCVKQQTTKPETRTFNRRYTHLCAKNLHKSRNKVFLPPPVPLGSKTCV